MQPVRSDPATLVRQRGWPFTARLRKCALGVLLLAALGGVLVTESRWPPGTLPHDVVEALGLGMVLACLLGRAWATLYVGGRKKLELVDDGPYSVTRNPLYVFSVLGACGVGAATGSLVMLVLAGSTSFAVFAIAVASEEAVRATRFGAQFDAYRARVPRLWPRWSQWKDVASIDVRPRLLMVTVRDAAMLLLAAPAAEGVEWLHAAHWLPTLFTLP